MGLMATGTSVQWIPGGGHGADRALPFYSRYYTNGTAGVDQDVSHMPASANACFLAAATVRPVPVAAKGGVGTSVCTTRKEEYHLFPVVGHASRRGGFEE